MVKKPTLTPNVENISRIVKECFHGETLIKTIRALTTEKRLPSHLMLLIR